MPQRQVLVRAEALSGRQAGLISLSQALAAGLAERAVRTLVGRGEWHRVTRAVYRTPVDTRLDAFDERRQQAAWAGLLAVPGAMATGMSALALHGLWGLPTRIPSEVCVPGGSSVQGPTGVRVRRYRRPIPAVMVNGFPVAQVVPALVQALPQLDREHGVAVLDSALHLGRAVPDDLVAVHRLLARRPGAPRARTYLALADGRAESPLETRARLCVSDAGLAPTTLQVAFRDRAGVLVARGDMGWRRPDGSWVIAELDGRDVHAAPEAVYRDRSRQNLLQTRGRVTMLRFTGRDLTNGVAVATVRRALAE